MMPADARSSPVRPAISVCMATYNGAQFIHDQLASILRELLPGDEVIVVDDGSRDDTVAVIQSFADARVVVHGNETNAGVNAAFERAILLARNEVIFLSDQDDTWMPGRTARMLDAMRGAGALLVSTNSDYVDNDGRPVDFPMRPLRRVDSRRHAKNIVDIFSGQAPYYGCAMAFERSLVPLICPIPGYVESHDLWIAMAANVVRSNVHLEDVTLHRRIHGNNASVVERPLASKLWSRVSFGLSLFHLMFRAMQWRRNPAPAEARA